MFIAFVLVFPCMFITRSHYLRQLALCMNLLLLLCLALGESLLRFPLLCEGVGHFSISESFFRLTLVSVNRSMRLAMFVEVGT
jgi:hypothetical protein